MLIIQIYYELIYTGVIEVEIHGGGMRLKKPLSPQLPTTPPTRGPSVEAECVVDDRVFAAV